MMARDIDKELRVELLFYKIIITALEAGLDEDFLHVTRRLVLFGEYSAALYELVHVLAKSPARVEPKAVAAIQELVPLLGNEANDSLAALRALGLDQ
jgi:hypothetical protein